MTYEIEHALNTFSGLLVAVGILFLYVVVMRTWLWFMSRKRKGK